MSNNARWARCAAIAATRVEAAELGSRQNRRRAEEERFPRALDKLLPGSVHVEAVLRRIVAPERTIREVVDRIVELGLIDASTPGKIWEAAELDKPLSYYGHTPGDALRSLLSELGIRYAFDYERFEGIGETDDDARLEWYRNELESIASCTRGTVTVTNVRLVENSTKWELQFDWNDTTVSWPVYPRGEREEVEASLTFATYLHTLDPGAAQRFCPCIPDPTTGPEKPFSAIRTSSINWARISGSASPPRGRSVAPVPTGYAMRAEQHRRHTPMSIRA